MADGSRQTADDARQTADDGRRRAGRVLLSCAALLLACGERRDIADLAVGVQPFDQLRGINATALRSGGVRAFRGAAAPSPFEGLREPIGSFDVVYQLRAFDGSDGSWPAEEALVAAIEATREWPSDASARAAFDGSVAALQDGLGVGPQCYDLAGPGFALRVAQWDRGGGWVVTTSLAPELRVGRDSTLSARHSVAVRREAVTVRYPRSGAPNPHERPTWTEASCSPD